jgi:hypothetical protein
MFRGAGTEESAKPDLELSYLSIGFSIRNGFLIIISTPEPSKQATLSTYLLQYGYRYPKRFTIRKLRYLRPAQINEKILGIQLLSPFEVYSAFLFFTKEYVICLCYFSMT